MAHVGAIGEIVGAIKAYEQLIEISSFVAGPAGCVKLGLIGGLQAFKDVPNFGKGIFPRDGQIGVAWCVIAHRVGQSSVEFELIIGKLAQFGNRMFGKECRCGALLRCFPRYGFDTVFAKLKR